LRIYFCRILKDSKLIPDDDCSVIRVRHEINLRQYCTATCQKTLGAYTTYHEDDHRVPLVTEKEDFWKFAHDLTVKNNSDKGKRVKKNFFFLSNFSPFTQ